MKPLLALLLILPFLTPAGGHGAESLRSDNERHEAFMVAAFGAQGDGKSDDGPAIQRAIDAAITAGRKAEVVFDAGKTYRLGARTSDIAVLQVGRARGLAISGNKATLIAHPSNRLLTIFDSRDVVVRDLVLDYDPLPFTQARLIEILLPEGAVRFRIESGYSVPTLGGEEVYRDFKSSDAVFLDGTTRTFTHDWGRLRNVKGTGPGVFEARFHGSNPASRLGRTKAGDYIAIKQHFSEPPSTRDREGRFLSSSSANIYIAFSRDVRLERVVSYAAPVMTFVASASEGVVLDGCKVTRKPNSDRLIAGNSDGAHFKSLTQMPQIRNSIFEALMDDSINIKISSEVVKEVQGAHVRLVHGDIATDDIVVEPGQYLSLLGGPTKRCLGDAKVLAVKRVGYREVWVTLESAPPELQAGDLAFLRPASDAMVSRCEFRSQLKTALVIHPPCLVSECVFADVAYGVHALFNSNIEGPPPFGLRVTQCEFTRPGVAAIALHLPSLNSGPLGRQSLVADQCRITVAGNRGVALTASHQEGIVLRNVQITAEDGRTRADLIKLNDCTDVSEENVSFKSLHD